MEGEPMDIIKEKYSISFKIPSVPPSVNSLYNVIFSMKKVEMKPEVRLWKTKSKFYVPAWKPESLTDTGILRFEATFHYPFYSKDAKMLTRDTHNMMKLLQDTVAEKVGINDKFIKEGSWQSRDSKEEFTLCKLSMV
jgi:Holliday junction resolvase RusA-like endonuclease